MYLVIDTETGGLTAETSLLSLYMGVVDDNFNLVDELNLNIKPDDGNYVVTAQGLDVNKIDLVEHDSSAVPFREAKTLVYEFIKTYGQNGKLIPIGQNVYFDILRINQLVKKGSWDVFVSHRVRDTGVIGDFLIERGRLEDIGTGLSDFIAHFNIKLEGNRHTAKGDALATLEVYKRLRKLC